MLCKYLIIYSREESSWISCNSIKSNLIKSYQQAYPNSLVHYTSSKESLQNITQTTQDLVKIFEKDSIDKIIFIDHDPCPAILIKNLVKKINEQVEKKPSIYIHIYGDFTFNLPYFFDLSYSKLFFITASERQTALVDRLSNQPTSMNLFFPVDENRFNFSLEKRIEFRKRYNFKDNELVLLYTGRLSLQKNIEIIFKILEKITHRKIHLVLAGEFDDLGGRFFGANQAIGYYYQKVLHLINHSHHQVSYIGKLEASEIINAYCGADIFISPSLYHDEDFGMAPAEAMASGLPSILTDWGGYASFHKAIFLPVVLNSEGHLLDLSPAINFLSEFNVTEYTEKRAIEGKVFLAEFSLSAFAKKIDQTLNSFKNTFTGLNSLASTYVKEFYNAQNKKVTSNINNIPSSENFYQQIYTSYLNSNIPKTIKLPYQVQWLTDCILNQNNTDFHLKESEYYTHMPHSGAIYYQIPFLFDYSTNQTPKLIRAGLKNLSHTTISTGDYLHLELVQQFNKHHRFYFIKSKNVFKGDHAFLIILPEISNDQILNSLREYLSRFKLERITLLNIKTNDDQVINFDFIQLFLKEMHIDFKIRNWKEAISEKLDIESGVIEINNQKIMSISYCTYYLMNQNIIKLSLVDLDNFGNNHKISPLSPYVELQLFEGLNE